MCRVLACPPGTKRFEALQILKEMEWGQNGKNYDGFGFSFINNEGKLITRKYALSFSELLKRGFPLLACMPSDKWVIAHERAASCGGIIKENSHPFQINDEWAICHNGYWKEHKIARLCLSNVAKYEGSTDSEVAANAIANIGPLKFAMSEEIFYAGVFLCLKKDGTLEVIKSSGDLAMHVREDKTLLLASELDTKKYKQIEASRGHYKFNANGTFNKFTKKEYTWVSSSISNSTDKNHPLNTHSIPMHLRGYNETDAYYCD